MADICPIETVARHGDQVDDVVEILSPRPTQFLDDDILGSGHPCFATALRHELPTSATKPLAMMRVVTKTKEFDSKPGG